MSRQPVAQIRTVDVYPSRMRAETIRWRSADASSDMGSAMSAVVNDGASCFLTVEAATLFAPFPPSSMPVDLRYHAPTVRPADSTAMPAHRSGRPTENCLLDTIPPRGTA